ncbi:FkbM family methyltransferase [Snuella sedimenti]|uniref:FkbM family methyltransferase n=1 Tax=Snuella sedimenti TaxID=2798802 RepID=A0A8J7LMS4_9FLAO|nr:FkbM family methyltransferase [Snuella sedimenti]MBJ6367914.1 FkbM family methyltransferase [Snuella sedimenti]
MKHLLVKIYTMIPDAIKRSLSQKVGFRRFSSFFLRPGGTYREVPVVIKKQYGDEQVVFKFYASVKTGARALRSGIETKLITNLIHLLANKVNSGQDVIGLDIGANFGYLSLVWSQTLCKHGGCVYAFEPNPKVFSSFSKSVRSNGLEDRIKLQNKVVGVKNGKVELYLNNATSNVVNDAETMVGSKTGSIMMDMVTLDAFVRTHGITTCDFIKIDVDGIELDILEGSKVILETFKPIFVVETNDDTRIIDFFKLHDYKVLDMNLVEYQMKNPLPPNVFCVPKQV